jgi:hypothetical protein
MPPLGEALAGGAALSAGGPQRSGGPAQRVDRRSRPGGFQPQVGAPTTCVASSGVNPGPLTKAATAWFQVEISTSHNEDHDDGQPEDDTTRPAQQGRAGSRPPLSS